MFVWISASAWIFLRRIKKNITRRITATTMAKVLFGTGETNKGRQLNGAGLMLKWLQRAWKCVRANWIAMCSKDVFKWKGEGSTSKIIEHMQHTEKKQQQLHVIYFSPISAVSFYSIRRHFGADNPFSSNVPFFSFSFGKWMQFYDQIVNSKRSFLFSLFFYSVLIDKWISIVNEWIMSLKMKRSFRFKTKNAHAVTLGIGMTFGAKMRSQEQWKKKWLESGKMLVVYVCRSKRK